MNKKRFGVFVIIAVLGLLLWHFFIKDYNYRISFTIKDTPGLVYSNLLTWDYLKDLKDSSNVELLKQIPYKLVEHEVVVHDSIFNYSWEIEKVTDSLTKVTVFVTDTKNTFKQNLNSPFRKNEFVKRSIANVQDLAQDWVDYRDKYRIGPVTTDNIPEQFCAYITVNSKANTKAGTMIRNIADVMGFINDNSLELQGDPFLQVTSWDEQDGAIIYDFCFPIKKQDSLNSNGTVMFKTVPEFKGIKTTFNGNYSISHNAWYTLLDYAKTNNIPVVKLPFEIYRNDPHVGGDPLEWSADVFLPIKN